MYDCGSHGDLSLDDPACKVCSAVAEGVATRHRVVLCRLASLERSLRSMGDENG